jgi:hypothetical protein
MNPELPVLLVVPAIHPLCARRHLIPQLVNPETHHIPPKLNQAHVAELVASKQFAVPVPVIPLTIDFDVKLSALVEQGEVQEELFLGILGDWA